MIYSVDGNIINIDGNVFTKRNNSLTFIISGKYFPLHYFNEDLGGIVTFEFNKPSSVEVNYGDGTIEIVNSVDLGNRHEIIFSLISGNNHTYAIADEYIITFEFQDLSALDKLKIRDAKFIGAVPQELRFATSLTEVSLVRTISFSSIPFEIFTSRKMKALHLSNALLGRLNYIPDLVFENPLVNFQVGASFNLSDVISSNFFKINQLKDTLQNVTVENCNVVEFPESFSECYDVRDLRADNNQFNKFPIEIAGFEFMRLLYIGNTIPLVDGSIPVLYNYRLMTLFLRFQNLNFSDIPSSWKYLYSLGNFSFFNLFVTSNQRFDEFIGYWYQLITENASITQDSGEFTEYPNRFRNISWGSSNLSFTGAKVAPQGYIQGVSNGAPATNGERAYVLQNQYGHTITHGQPII